MIDHFLEKTALESSTATVVVGMSGGVDSSVTAAILKELGYDVIGILMKNWEDDTGCSIEQDAQDVARVASMLGIPFYTAHFAQKYKDEVFSSFLEDLKAGLTPNPDILCNSQIKFKYLLDKALSLGAESLATGHYAAIEKDNDLYTLCRAADSTKDQTYFLYTASQRTLSHTLFPLAHLLKSEVRQIATELKLPVAEKKDSTGICFIGERKFTEFLKPYLGLSPGKMITLEGEQVGEHSGLCYYTIGQRRGLGIGGEGQAWFVVDKDVENNLLIVAQGADHAALYADELYIKDLHWIAHTPELPLTCTAKIRYRQEDQSCRVEGNRVCFTQPQRAITAGQAIVFYQGKECLGGATIVARGPTLYEKA